MLDRLRFFFTRLSERLWVRPLLVCIVSIIGVFFAKLADYFGLAGLVPDINARSIETLLSVMSSSMLVIATLAVASMLSAYASASSNATPRSFALVIADDVSQNSLSTFVGAFIFSVVSLIALSNGYYEKAGRFALFVFTLVTLAVVVVTFVRWVDSVARLGRLGATISKVEEATAASLERRRLAPTLRGVALSNADDPSVAVSAQAVGYVQRVDVRALQACAEQHKLRIVVAALPGTFATRDRTLAYVIPESGELDDIDTDAVLKAFVIGKERRFDDDPRFGLVVLSQIAIRALSPAVNDPGTAIDILATYVRLFSHWSEPLPADEGQAPACDRVEVPRLALGDLFDDAFIPISRDGAGLIEVAGRLQKALHSLACVGDDTFHQVACEHSRWALTRAEQAMQAPQDLEHIRELASFSRLA